MMARDLDQLPTEILLSIAQSLPDQRDIYALVQTSRNLYNSLYHFLCLHNVRQEKGSALLFAAQNGYTGLANKLLDVGLDISPFESPNEVAYDKRRDEEQRRAEADKANGKGKTSGDGAGKKFVTKGSVRKPVMKKRGRP